MFEKVLNKLLAKVDKWAKLLKFIENADFASPK